jgi:hypothetical protein
MDPFCALPSDIENEFFDGSSADLMYLAMAQPLYDALVAQLANLPHEPLKLNSSVAAPATAQEVWRHWPGMIIPDDATALWSACRGARLFEDVEYGQWGLVILDPKTSAVRTVEERTARPHDLRSDDVVIGEFLGDQELLVIAPSERGQRRILVALPLDPRDDWFGAADALDQFLEKYFDASGDKFWERHR